MDSITIWIAVLAILVRIFLPEIRKAGPWCRNLARRFYSGFRRKVLCRRGKHRMEFLIGVVGNTSLFTCRDCDYSEERF